jgi:magnesium transporter
MGYINNNNTIHRLSFDTKHRKTIFLDIPEEKRGAVLLQLTKYIQGKLVSSLSNEELLAVLNELDPDEASDILRLLPKRRRKKIVGSFGEELKKHIKILGQFDPETAAGLMKLNYVQVRADDTIREVAKQVAVHEKRTGHLPVIIVMEEEHILGYLPGHVLGLAKRTEKAKMYAKRILAIRHDATPKEVVHFFREHPHNKIVVLGDHRNVVGIIYSDDLLRVLREEASALYDFAGVHKEESVLDTARQKVKYRYKWLVLNLGTAFLAAGTVSLFEETISTYVLLAIYMPIVAGMGGNAGTQTLAVLVRGIALNQITLQSAWPTLRREITASLMNGIMNGFLVAGIAMFFHGDPVIALILGSAMVINLLVAGTFGTLVPLIMQRLGKDPATSATVFITTATDVLGFLAFLGIATIILP